MTSGRLFVKTDDEDFDRVWALHPRHDAKLAAKRRWARLKPSKDLVEKMIWALTWQIPFYQWDGENKHFAPYLATWLHGERWEDEPPMNLTRPTRPGGKLRADGLTHRSHEVLRGLGRV